MASSETNIGLNTAVSDSVKNETNLEDSDKKSEEQIIAVESQTSKEKDLEEESQSTEIKTSEVESNLKSNNIETKKSENNDKLDTPSNNIVENKDTSEIEQNSSNEDELKTEENTKSIDKPSDNIKDNDVLSEILFDNDKPSDAVVDTDKPSDAVVDTDKPSVAVEDTGEPSDTKIDTEKPSDTTAIEKLSDANTSNSETTSAESLNIKSDFKNPETVAEKSENNVDNPIGSGAAITDHTEQNIKIYPDSICKKTEIIEDKDIDKEVTPSKPDEKDTTEPTIMSSDDDKPIKTVESETKSKSNDTEPMETDPSTFTGLLSTTEFGDSLPSDLLKPDVGCIEASQLLTTSSKQNPSLTEDLIEGVSSVTKVDGQNTEDPFKIFAGSKVQVQPETSTTFTDVLKSNELAEKGAKNTLETAAKILKTSDGQNEKSSETNMQIGETVDSPMAFSDTKEGNLISSEPASVSEMTGSPGSAMETNESVLSKMEVESTKSDHAPENVEIPSNSQSNEASLSNTDRLSLASEDATISSVNNKTEFKFDIKKQLAASNENEESNESSEVTTRGTRKRKAIEVEKVKEEEDTKSQDGITPRRTRRRRGGRRHFNTFKKAENPSLIDEDTRMELPEDEDSQNSTNRNKKFRCEIALQKNSEEITAEKLIEYEWPEGTGELYFIQEHVSEYLGIMSFKRKYPSLRRHTLDMQEKDHLKEMGIVNEMACDLGLTAIRSDDVMDIMINDFPDKFEEMQELLRERHEKKIKEHGKVEYQVADLDKSKIHEYSKKAAESAARWNANLNKERKEERRYSFDLQTFTLQLPQSRAVKLPPEATKLGAYPVAVLPGQYSDYYKSYTPEQLRFFPLNTIIGKPEDALQENKENQEEVDGKASVNGDEVKEEAVVPTEPSGPNCKVCHNGKERNKQGNPEELVTCASCKSSCHLSCVELDPEMVKTIRNYGWKCMDCKSCESCKELNDEEKMIFCDMCDRGYHIYCVGLRRVPNGRWHCKNCAVCFNCGTKNPSGNEYIKNAEWAHNFKKDKGVKKLRYAVTLCMPCDKYWKRRQFCYICSKVYRSIPEDGMVRCVTCPKYVHREGGCSTLFENERYCKMCFKARNSTALNHSRILAAAKRRMAMSH